jgi:hypothetical protein
MKVLLFSGKKRCKDNENNQHQNRVAPMTMKLDFNLTYGSKSTCKLQLKTMLVSYICNGRRLEYFPQHEPLHQHETFKQLEPLVRWTIFKSKPIQPWHTRLNHKWRTWVLRI